MNLVWVDGRREMKIDGAPKSSYKRRFPALLWSMEKTNGMVCGDRQFIIMKVKIYNLNFPQNTWGLSEVTCTSPGKTQKMVKKLWKNVFIGRRL